MVSTKKIVGLLGSFFKDIGVRDMVISPGSRNAPFTITYTQDDSFNCHSVIDERSAAFVALGMAQKTKKPIVIICTSGSAVLNYYPAIAEAYYQRIPLIVLSADRPEWAIDNGQGQTIRQKGVLDLHVENSISIDAESNDSLKKKKNIESLKEIFLSQKVSQLPIHINVHFDEPLYDIESFQPELISPINWYDTVKEEDCAEEELIETWMSKRNKWIILGQTELSNQEKEILQKLAQRDDVLIWTESTSQFYSENCISSIDVFLEGNPLMKQQKPDLLIQLGGAIISKKIKAFLQAISRYEYWSVSPYNHHPKIYGEIDKKIQLSISSFIRKVGQFPVSITEEIRTMKEENIRIEEKKKNYLEGLSTYSDLLILHSIVEQLPLNSVIHSANSSIIRYLQLLDLNGRSFYANRGTSGIDGSTSTAVGFSNKDNEHLNVLFTGDISFFYDSNAFWNKLESNLKIVLLNNAGGSIFRIIPGAKETKVREEFFATHHSTSAKDLCKTYQIEYCSVGSLETLKTNWEEFVSKSGIGVMEIFVDKEIGPKELKSFFAIFKESNSE
jgi:2-succinyl-5-enolpyruvyl-6-hydroxy-3-cyclohexene-1-carboxylate synthase